MFTFANQAQISQRFWADSSSYVPTLLNVCKSEGLGTQDYPHWHPSANVSQLAVTGYAFVSLVSSWPVTGKHCSHCVPIFATTKLLNYLSARCCSRTYTHKSSCPNKVVPASELWRAAVTQQQNWTDESVYVYRFACVGAVLLLKVCLSCWHQLHSSHDLSDLFFCFWI